MLAKVMITWIPLYLTGKALPFFVSPHTQSGSINQGLLLLKDKMLLQSMSPADESFESTTLATNNEHLLSESYRLLQKSMRYAIPLFSFYYRAEHSKYGIFLSQMVKLDDDQYLFMRFPFVNIIPSIQIQGILTDNSINGETRNKAMQTCRALKTDVRRDSGHHFRYLIPQSQLAELLSQEYIMLDVVSFIVGQPLYISNKVFRDLLKKMVTMLSQDSHQIIREVVLLEDVHVKQLKNLNMLVKKNTCLSIFNSPEHYASGNEPLVMTTTESTFVHSSYLFCEQLWNNTLPQTREHTYVARQLEILMETVPVPTSQQES